MMTSSLGSTGMCMCVQACAGLSSATAHILGGFEDGSVVLWDCRNPSRELSSLKVFAEPGRLKARSVTCVPTQPYNIGVRVVAGFVTTLMVIVTI